MTVKASPPKLGNEIYGKMKIEKAFLEALELYFIKQDKNSWLIRSFYFNEEHT